MFEPLSPIAEIIFYIAAVLFVIIGHAVLWKEIGRNRNKRPQQERAMSEDRHPTIIETWCKTNGCRADVYRQEIGRLKAANKWMRREIERVGIALFTGANGYVGTEDDLKAVGQFVEGVCETLEKLEADNLRFIKANAEVASLNADLQIENAGLREALQMVEWQPIHDPDTHELLGQLCLWCHRKPHSIHCRRQAALEADLSKLATQQKPTEEAMLSANPSCGMDGCLWE